MKKLLTVLAAALAISTPALAATSQTVNATASVNAVLDLTVGVFKIGTDGNPTGSNLGTSMPFGLLTVDTTNGVLHGADPYAVFLGTNTSSRPYTIKATMPAMSNGTTTLPPAMVMSVVSAKAGTADIAGDAFTVGGQNAIMTNQTIYTSNTTGTAASVQLVYGISGGQAVGTPFTGWQPILLSQASGNYSANATYTIALV